MRWIILPIIIFVVAAALAEQQPYERYQSIVERQMFGAPPAGFDPTKMPSEVAKTKGKADQELSQEQEQIKKAIKFSVLNVTSEGEIIVGFSDNGDAKNPLHYYLKVGESQNGWTVKEADKDEATMTIEKEGIEVTLKLGGDSASDANAVSRTGVANNTRTKTPGSSSLFGNNKNSLREQRRLRDEKRAEEDKKRAEDDKKREERDKQRDADFQELQNEFLKIKIKNERLKEQEMQQELKRQEAAQRKQEQEAQETAETPSDEHSDETSKESEE